VFKTEAKTSGALLIRPIKERLYRALISAAMSTSSLETYSPKGCMLMISCRHRATSAVCIYFQSIAKKGAATSAFYSQSKSISINGYLSLSLFCLTSRSCHLILISVQESSSVCLAQQRSNKWKAQPHHILDATMFFGPLDSQHTPKSIVKLSHTAFLGSPQPRISNLPVFTC
jgi:hypothetical protein